MAEWSSRERWFSADLDGNAQVHRIGRSDLDTSRIPDSQVGEWQLSIGARQLSVTDLEWRGLKVTHVIEVVCNCAAGVRDFEFNSDLINGQRPKVRAPVEMECSTLCRECSKREWGQGGDTCGKLKHLGEEVRRWCCNRWVTVMDMVIFRTIFFELLVFFTFTLLIIHFAY